MGLEELRDVPVHQVEPLPDRVVVAPPRVDQVSIHPVLDEVLVAVEAGRDHRKSGRHRLEQAQAERLLRVVDRRDQHVRHGEEVRLLLEWEVREQPDVRLEPVTADEPLDERQVLGSCPAGQQQNHRDRAARDHVPGQHPAQRAEVHLLSGGDASEDQQHDCVGRDPESCPALRTVASRLEQFVVDPEREVKQLAFESPARDCLPAGQQAPHRLESVPARAEDGVVRREAGVRQPHRVIDHVPPVEGMDHGGDGPPRPGVSSPDVVQACHHPSPAAQVEHVEVVLAQDARQFGVPDAPDTIEPVVRESPALGGLEERPQVDDGRVAEDEFVELAVAEDGLDEVVVGDKAAHVPLVLAAFEERED